MFIIIYYCYLRYYLSLYWFIALCEIKFVDYSKWTFHFKPCLLTGSCEEMKKFASENMRWKKKESYWLTQQITAHGSGSVGCWKTRAREENSRPRSRTTVFTLTDYRAIQQTRQRIAQCKPSFIVAKIKCNMELKYVS